MLAQLHSSYAFLPLETFAFHCGKELTYLVSRVLLVFLFFFLPSLVFSQQLFCMSRAHRCPLLLSFRFRLETQSLFNANSITAYSTVKKRKREKRNREEGKKMSRAQHPTASHSVTTNEICRSRALNNDIHRWQSNKKWNEQQKRKTNRVFSLQWPLLLPPPRVQQSPKNTRKKKWETNDERKKHKTNVFSSFDPHSVQCVHCDADVCLEV